MVEKIEGSLGECTRFTILEHLSMDNAGEHGEVHFEIPSLGVAIDTTLEELGLPRRNVQTDK